MNLKLANKNHLVIKNQALSNLILQTINIISRTDTCQSETKVYILFCQSAILLQRWLSKNRDSCVEVFCKNGVPECFAKFTGKNLCRSLFFKKVVGFKRRL